MPLVFENELFVIEAPEEPHVCRTDGGHMVIHPKVPVVNRWDLEPRRAKALMCLSMIAGEAMLRAMNERGVPVERINFQDNGNWGIGTPQGPRFHLHLYGRARGSRNQAHGEALYFPSRSSRFWEALEGLNEGDCAAIRRQMEKLAREDRYQPGQWT